MNTPATLISVWMIFNLNAILVETRGCFHDPKIFVVTITLSRQKTLLEEAKKKCATPIDISPKIEGLHCKQTFDDIMCWPPTKAGSVAKQQCPDYINKFYTRAQVQRYCLENGEWYTNPETNKTWSNYTDCIKEPEYFTDDRSLSRKLGHVTRIKIMYTLGYSVSFLCLVLAICIMSVFRKLRCHRNTIHLNLFASFAMRSVICLVKDLYHTPSGETTIENETAKLATHGSNWTCKMVYSLFHYVILANYTWIFIEGLYLHSLIFLTTAQNNSNFPFFIIFGWSFPLVCVIPWIVVRKYLEDTMCWSTHDTVNKFDWILRGPIVLSVVINFIFFINLIRVLFTKMNDTQNSVPHRHRRLVRSTLVLIPLFGVYYMISVAMPDCMEGVMEIVWLYIESGVNSFQGLLVALLFCFLNGEVKTELGKKCIHFPFHKIFLNSRCCRIQKSATHTKSTKDKETYPSNAQENDTPLLKRNDEKET